MMLSRATSFCNDTDPLSSAGSTLRTAWGSTAWRSVWACERPRARAAMRWLSCTASMPARNTSAVYAE